jgi:diguanylate cyclase (GGDEF)-like protein
MKPAPPLISLERKLIAALGFAALLFSLIAGGADYLHTYRNELDRSRASFDNLAATVQSSAAIAAFVGNATIADDIAEGLLKNQEILGVQIQGGRNFSFRQAKIVDTEEWPEHATLSYPLYSPTLLDENIGQLSILTDARLLEARARAAAFTQLLFLIGQTLLLAAILAFTYRQLVGRPLLHLTQTLVAIEPGSDQRIPIADNDRDNEIGHVAGSVNHYLEISERALMIERELLARVQKLESHYRRIFESAKVGIMVLEMDGSLINCNAAVSNRAEQAGPPSGEDSDYLARIFKQPAKAWALIEQARSSGLVVNGDLELLNNEGESRWAHCLFSIGRFPEEDQHYIEAVFYDVTSRRMREEKALRSAKRDVLTDLINRRGALAYLEQALVDARLEGKGVTLFFFDLDGFKSINDTYGHAAGDIVLVEVARRLRGVRKRSSDLLARLGGDEFVLAAYGMHKTDDGAHQLAQALLTTMQTPIALDQGQTACIGVSIGIAGYPENADNVAALLETADQAMYSAKKRGKNRYQVAASKM